MNILTSHVSWGFTKFLILTQGRNQMGIGDGPSRRDACRSETMNHILQSSVIKAMGKEVLLIQPQSLSKPLPVPCATRRSS